MNDNSDNNPREEIDRAFGAVQKHVLPGLLAAWDEAGPPVALVLAGVLADTWVESGFKVSDLAEMMTPWSGFESVSKVVP